MTLEESRLIDGDSAKRAIRIGSLKRQGEIGSQSSSEHPWPTVLGETIPVGHLGHL